MSVSLATLAVVESFSDSCPGVGRREGASGSIQRATHERPRPPRNPRRRGPRRPRHRPPRWPRPGPRTPWRRGRIRPVLRDGKRPHPPVTSRRPRSKAWCSTTTASPSRSATLPRPRDRQRTRCGEGPDYDVSLAHPTAARGTLQLNSVVVTAVYGTPRRIASPMTSTSRKTRQDHRAGTNREGRLHLRHLGTRSATSRSMSTSTPCTRPPCSPARPVNVGPWFSAQPSSEVAATGPDAEGLGEPGRTQVRGVARGSSRVMRARAGRSMQRRIEHRADALLTRAARGRASCRAAPGRQATRPHHQPSRLGPRRPLVDVAVRHDAQLLGTEAVGEVLHAEQARATGSGWPGVVVQRDVPAQPRQREIGVVVGA